MEQERIYTVETDESFGELQISDEVVAIIAGLATTEVEGVVSIAGNLTRDLIAKMGKKNLSKGVIVEVKEGHVRAKLNLNLRYGYSVPAVCSKVQERVKNAIENMTGLEVDCVNVSIAGVTV
ncbi:MAG: Asp23/Gls24 family envelope stress response protein [Lachnospiraceae bacterium]